MSNIFFDIETDGYESTVVWCMCVHKDDQDLVLYTQKEIEEFFNSLTEEDILIGHNILGFDLPTLYKLYPLIKPHRNVQDTLVIGRVLYPDLEGGHSLKAWGMRLNTYKTGYDDFSKLTPEMVEYCKQDVQVTITLYNYLNKELNNYNYKEALDIEYNIYNIIRDQEKNGVYFNKEKAKELIDILHDKIYNIYNELYSYYIPKVIYKSTIEEPYKINGELKLLVTKWCDINNIPYYYICGPFSKIDYEEFNPNSDIQIKEILLRLGWKPNQLTPSGQPSLKDTQGIEALGGIGTQVLQMGVIQHRIGLVQGLIERVRADSRVSAAANSCATNTGRMAHIGVANIPRVGTYLGKEIRSLFCVPKGKVLLGYDAKGLELRILAHFINDENYSKIVAFGDPHEFAREAAGLPNRDSAKTLNYALIYGARDKRLGSIVGGGVREGATIRGRLFQAIPGFKSLSERVEKSAKKGYLKALDGRKLHIREGKSPLNTLLQGNGAICMKWITVCVINKLNSIPTLKDKVFKVLDMHDEAQYECENTDIATQFAELVKESFVECNSHFKLKCPLACDIKVGTTWAETH